MPSFKTDETAREPASRCATVTVVTPGVTRMVVPELLIPWKRLPRRAREWHAACIPGSMVEAPARTELLAIEPGRRVRILYVNASGQSSERSVDVHRRYTSRAGVTYFVGHCHSRGEERTFRADRVLAVLSAAARSGTPVATSPAARLELGPGTPARAFVATRDAPSHQQEPGRQEPARRRSGVGLTVVLVVALAVAGYVTTRPPSYTRVEQARVDALAREFSARTGITDAATIALFVDADVDRDATLSWDEIIAFQRRLRQRYRYLHNDTALRPDHFLEAGGGDCEDWALVTAGLLRFWRIDVAIGVVSSARGVHAVAFVPARYAPPDMDTVRVPRSIAGPAAGCAADACDFVVIDYTSVGRFSSAVDGDYTVTHVYVPESIYGAPM